MRCGDQRAIALASLTARQWHDGTDGCVVYSRRMSHYEEIDEGPSPEDLERFGGDGDDTGYCPQCGEEVWDQVDVCPQCGHAMTGGPGSRAPFEAWWRRRTILLVTIIVLIAFVLLFVL